MKIKWLWCSQVLPHYLQVPGEKAHHQANISLSLAERGTVSQHVRGCSGRRWQAQAGTFAHPGKPSRVI